VAQGSVNPFFLPDDATLATR